MANKNQQRVAKLLRKERKTGKAVDTSFGSKGNNHKNPRKYKVSAPAPSQNSDTVQ